jgi:hypothetical protein
MILADLYRIFGWESIVVRLPLTPILTFSGDRQPEITAESYRD